MAGVITVDDTNPNISYSDRDWRRQTNRNPDLFDGSMTFTNVEGAAASLQFEGSSIIVMGSVLARGTPPMSVYVIDDENPVAFIPTPGTTTQNGIVFYRSPPLQFGRHSLTIMNARGGTSPLILDAFTINTQPQTNVPLPPAPNPPNQPTATNSPTLSLPLPSSTTPSTSTAVISSTSSPVPVPVPVPAPRPSDDLPPVIVTITASRSTSASSAPTPGSNGALSGAGLDADGEKKGGGSNAGAIAGGVVAAIVGIGLLIVAFWYWRRRQRKQRSAGGTQPLRRHSSFWNKPSGVTPASPPITPFVLDSDLPPSPPSQYQSQRRPAPPPPQMSQQPYNQASSRSYNQAQNNASGYGQAYQFSAAPQNIPPPIVANNRFSTADSMYTDGPGAREGEVDPYGGYAPSSAAPPPLPTKGPTLAIANPFYPQAVNTSVPDLTQSQYQYQPQPQPQPQQAQAQAQAPYRNPSQQPRRAPTKLQYVPPSQAQFNSQYVPPSQLLNTRLQGGGGGSGYDSYGRGMPVPNADPPHMYAAQSQGKRERIRLD